MYNGGKEGLGLMKTVRTPKQKRSVEKKLKIIEKGFELMCDNGYYKTNTNDIAKYANVSTGIIYQYFTDKKDIFMEGVKNYSEKIMYPILSVLESKKVDLENIDETVNKMIDELVKAHTMSKKAHEELLAMSHIDTDVSNILKMQDIKTTEKIVGLLKENNINISNPLEKVHIITNILDNFCHEVVYHRHKKINYDIMKKEVIKVIINMVKEKQN